MICPCIAFAGRAHTVLAFLIDWLFILTISIAIVTVSSPEGIGVWLAFAIPGLYYAWLSASPTQATLGRLITCRKRRAPAPKITPLKALKTSLMHYAVVFLIALNVIEITTIASQFSLYIATADKMLVTVLAVAAVYVILALERFLFAERQQAEAKPRQCTIQALKGRALAGRAFMGRLCHSQRAACCMALVSVFTITMVPIAGSAIAEYQFSGPPSAKWSERVKVCSATSCLKAGKVIEESDVCMVKLPPRLISAHVIRESAGLYGKIAAHNIRVQDIFISDDVQEPPHKIAVQAQ